MFFHKKHRRATLPPPLNINICCGLAIFSYSCSAAQGGRPASQILLLIVVLPQSLSYAGLPFSKDLVDSKPALRGSNIPAIQLWQKPCWANLFDGQVAAGPIPVLLSQFAEDPDLIQVAIVPALINLSPLFLSHSWT